MHSLQDRKVCLQLEFFIDFRLKCEIEFCTKSFEYENEQWDVMSFLLIKFSKANHNISELEIVEAYSSYSHSCSKKRCRRLVCLKSIFD